MIGHIEVVLEKTGVGTNEILSMESNVNDKFMKNNYIKNDFLHKSSSYGYRYLSIVCGDMNIHQIINIAVTNNGWKVINEISSLKVLYMATSEIGS